MYRLTALLLLMLMSLPLHSGWDPSGDDELVREARQTIEEFRRQDPSLSRFFSQAKAYAVYPTVGKAGFWIGGAYGEGVVFSGGKVIGLSDLKQVSLGLQFGGQAYSEIIFFRDQTALDRLKAEKMEFDAQVSAVVADRGAAANADYHHGVAVFTLTKGGLMAEASVGGQSFSFTPR